MPASLQAQPPHRPTAAGFLLFLLLLLLLLLLLPTEVQTRPPGTPDSGLRLEAIKQSILARLGMERPPSIRQALGPEGLREARRHYQETLAQLRGNQSTPAVRATTVHLLRPELKPRDEGWARRLPAADGHLGRFYSLEVSRTAALLRQNLDVLRAELSLYKEPPDPAQPNATTRPGQVKIYRLAAGDRGAPELLASRVLLDASPDIGLRDAVQQWLAGSVQSLRLGLEVPALLDAPLATLQVETRELGRVRRARQLDEECGKAGGGNCCLRTLKVSFEAIGWSDWVVAPSSYSMKFCEGSCPHNYKPASMHAQIKARLHSLSGQAPAPCCVPAAYEPMVLMHYASDGKVVTQLFDDMIVTGCHCA